LLQNREISFHRLKSAQLEFQEETMVFFQLPFQGRLQFGDLLAQKPLGQLGHLLRGRFSFCQSLEHELSRDTENIAGHARQLDVGRLQQLQETVALRRLAFHQLAAVAH
jgi:hypothetical protein